MQADTVSSAASSVDAAAGLFDGLAAIMAKVEAVVGYPPELEKWIREHKVHSKVMPQGAAMTVALVHADISRGKDGYGGNSPPAVKVSPDQLQTLIEIIAQENKQKQLSAPPASSKSENDMSPTATA